jgi:hypothetical protein
MEISNELERLDWARTPRVEFLIDRMREHRSALAVLREYLEPGSELFPEPVPRGTINSVKQRIS